MHGCCRPRPRCREYRRLEAELESAEALRTDADPAMRALGEEEAARLRAAAGGELGSVAAPAVAP